MGVQVKPELSERVRPSGARAAWRAMRSSSLIPVLAAVLVVALLAPASPVGTGGSFEALAPDGGTVAPPFGVGEKLTFEIKYGFVSAGTAVLGIPRLIDERGYECYHIVSLAESNQFFSVFFTVRDVAESYLDVRELVPRRFEKRLHEGEFRAHDLVIYDHERGLARYPRQEGRIVPVSAGAQDILSSLYYVRLMPLEVGHSVFIENHADKKNYPLEIKVLKRERVSVPAGEFNCIVVEPVVVGPGLFSHKGRLTVWLTDDEARIPVQMKSKVVIGSVAAVLTDLDYANVGS
jgi:hypothetical protein